MTAPTPLARGDVILRRSLDGEETAVARYVKITHPDGTATNAWYLSPGSPPRTAPTTAG